MKKAILQLNFAHIADLDILKMKRKTAYVFTIYIHRKIKD